MVLGEKLWEGKDVSAGVWSFMIMSEKLSWMNELIAM
jgi:hypothetical protein